MSVETPTIEEEKTSGQTEKEVELKEVAELEKPIKKIKDRIERGEYGLIIGDDASGRIPTLILGNFIKKVSEQKGQERPNIIFIPGKLSDFAYDSMGEFKIHLEKWGFREGKRILIVTDTILSGESLEILVKLIKRLGHDCDIATIGLERPISGMVERKLNLGITEIVSGKYKNKNDKKIPHTPQIYKSDYSGVSKSAGDWVSYRPGRFDEEERRQENQHIVNESRENANILVNKLIDWYESRTK